MQQRCSILRTYTLVRLNRAVTLMIGAMTADLRKR